MAQQTARVRADRWNVAKQLRGRPLFLAEPQLPGALPD